MGILRTTGWFVGNGLDRSVQSNHSYDVSGKRAIRRDFMRCAQPAVRRGQDTRPTLLSVKGLFLEAVYYLLFVKRPVLFVPKAQTPPYLLSFIFYLLSKFIIFYLLSFI